MSDDDKKEERAKTEIPKWFSISEQVEQMRMVYTERKQFIDSRLAANKAIAPSKDLAMLYLARIAAAGETLAKLLPEEEKARQKIMAVAEELHRMGKPVSIGAIRTFIPSEHHELVNSMEIFLAGKFGRAAPAPAPAAEPEKPRETPPEPSAPAPAEIPDRSRELDADGW